MVVTNETIGNSGGGSKMEATNEKIDNGGGDDVTDGGHD